MEIDLTGPVGTSGALKLYKDNKDFFEARFQAFFCRQIEQMEQPCENDNYEIMLAKYADCIYICTITDGGLYGALWGGCEKLNCGCEVFLKRIPIRQETVEITELTGDDPYEIESFGDLLIFSDNSQLPPREWVWIGRTTDMKDRVIINDANRRFLTPPKRQKTDTQNRKRK